jgi:hypothetical protein
MIIEDTIIELSEEALDFLVSPKHGGRCGTTKEKDTAPWWHEEYTKFVHAVHGTVRTHKGDTHSTTTLNSFIRSTTIHSEVFQWTHHEDGGGGGGEACAKF